MTLKIFIFVMCYLALLSEIQALGSMGPLGKITINSLYECTDDKPEGDEINIIKMNLINVNEKGDKGLDVIIENKIPFDDDLNYVIDIKKFENGGWKKFYNVKGKPCRDYDRYLKKLWTKVTAALEPKVNKPCPIPPGTYTLNKFQVTPQDIDAKAIFYGKLLIKVTAGDKHGKHLFCAMAEADSQAPMLG